MRLSSFAYLIGLLCVISHSRAQLLVSVNSNASTLVNEIVGNNVTTSNATINCNSLGSGLFLSNSSNIGLSSGILLTTGKAVDAIGPNNSPNKGIGFSNCATCINFTDPDLQAIIPNARFDGCVLEFDIVPICNKLEIRYVFGSEEYPMASVPQGSNSYYDVFGFFVTGPNPAGGSYAAYNIARLPNGSQVSINTINNGSSNNGPCVNCAYYINNTGGTTVQYDGFTTPLTASVNVVPCTTYHMKLAIADAGNNIYDSGVFLEHKGIGCAASSIPSITTATTISKCDLHNGTASVTVSNATGPVSYAWSPGGQTSAGITNLAPGTYVCNIGFQQPCPYTETVTLVVPHDPGFTPATTVTDLKCPQGSNGSATVTVSNGTAPYTYQWNTTPPQTGNTASGLVPGEYVCTVTDASGCVKKDTVEVLATSTLTLNPIATDAICQSPSGSIGANASGGVPAYSYSWSTTPVQTGATASGLIPGTYSVTVTDLDGCSLTRVMIVNSVNPATVILSDSLVNPTCAQPNGAIYLNAILGSTAPYTYAWSTTPVQTSQNATGLLPGTYSVAILDANGCPKTQSFSLTNLSALPLSTEKKDDTCDQHEGSISITVPGGTPPLSYAWSDGQSTPSALNLSGGTYTITVTDAGGCSASETILLLNNNDAFNGQVSIAPAEPAANNTFTLSLNPGAGWHLDLGIISPESTTHSLVNTLDYADYGWYNATYYLTSDHGCKHTLSYDFFVKDAMTLYIPNTFTPNGDGVNDIFLARGTLVREFDLSIYDRWGQLVFRSNSLDKGWDGTFRGNAVQVGTYVYRVAAKDYFNHEQLSTGHVNLIR